ncbi:MAG TPA: type II toxin-antitoxin system VapC family toxin [Gemmataceae bacterium]|nr:type II toxin-antitoxin system VapC family toxin [Gemmataceae bacterium]
MASYFFDSSAITKRYVTEAGSAWVRSLTARKAQNDLILARITEVEVTSALTRHRPPLLPADLRRALKAFQVDCRWRFRFVAIDRSLVVEAADLVPKHRLRGYDAVQLAALLEAGARNRARGLPVPILVSADADLNAAAAAEGFAVDDPNTHP